MENAQFERLLDEIAQSRRRTEEVAATLSGEMRHNSAETIALLRDEMRHGSTETVGMLRDEMRLSITETIRMLRDEMRQGTAETIGLLSDEIRRSTAETVGMLRDEIRSSAEDSRRHFGVIAESLGRNDQLLAEGFATLDARIDRIGADLRTEIVETRAMIKLSYVELDRRLSTLETARAQ